MTLAIQFDDIRAAAARLRLLDKRGRLVIRSHPGRGTAIRMYLPLVELLEEDLDDDTPVDRG